MKFIGRIAILSISITVSLIEAVFFEETTLMSILEALFFATIAYCVGWVFDRFFYIRKKAELGEKRYRDIIEFSPEPIIICQDERIVFVNKQLEQLVGVDSEHILGKSIFEFIIPELFVFVEESIQKLNTQNKDVERMDLKIKVNQNRFLDIEVSSVPIIYNNKPAIEVLFKDVTQQKKLEQQARENKELYRFIMENSTDVISYIKPNGRYKYLSPSSNQVLGYKSNEIIGLNVLDFIHSEEIETLSQIFIEVQSNFDFRTFPHRFRKKDGSFIWLETNVRTIRNNTNDLVGIVAVSRDINERIKKEKKLLETNEKLLYLSKMDGLTDIPNRRHFEETLKNEWNRTMRDSMPLSALMIDIDYFKKYNDYYGHQAGDECLKKIASAIKNVLKRTGDFVARYGGEEFVVLLPETDKSEAVYIGEVILETIRSLKIKTDVSEISNFVTISIGCATLVPKQSKMPNDLIKLADKKLYTVKESGRNQIK